MTRGYDQGRRRALFGGLAAGIGLGLASSAAVGGAVAADLGMLGADAGPGVRQDAGTAALQRLLDEHEIRRVVDAIDTTVDAKAWDACRTYFAETVEVDFTSLVGGAPATIPADALVGAWRRNLHAEKKSFHMRSNHQVTVDGDRARVVSMGYAFNQLPSRVGSNLWEVWGEYRHALVRTAEGWKVSAMALTVLHTDGNERARDFVPGA